MRRLILSILMLLVMTTHAGASGFPAKRVYERFAPSVVLIFATKGEGTGMIGAGSIISKAGLIVTNAHVVVDKKSGHPYPVVRVYLKPPRVTGIPQRDLKTPLRARVLHYTTELDLALLRVSGLPQDINIIELADPKDIKVGEEVVAIGHPEQGGLWSLTYGRISGEISDFHGIKGKDMYQTDTSVNRGNSGGPLLDRRGYMVAVNSNIARIGRGGLPITGVNFSIKSSVVKRWLEENGITIAYGKKPLREEEVAMKPAVEKDDKALKEELKRELREELKKELEEELRAKVEKQVKAETVSGKEKKPSHVAEREDEAVKFRKTRGEEEGKPQGAEKKEARTGEQLITPRRPYDYDALLRAVEAELEDMMEEMRGKIRRMR